MQPMKTLASQFLAISERSPALEMREDFSTEFLAELYKVPVESFTTTEMITRSPTEFGNDSFIPIRISGGMALEFRALCVTAAQMLEPSRDPVGRWWIELCRHFPTNASVGNESHGGTITNAAFWSGRLCDILSDPSGESGWSGYHAPGLWYGPFDLAATQWRDALRDKWIPSGFAERDTLTPKRGKVRFKRAFLQQRGVAEPEQ